MKLTARIAVVALLATLFVSPAFAQKKKARGAQAGLFSPAVQKAVPGINAVVKLSKEQRKQLATLRKENLEDEKLVELRKKLRDKSASRQDKKAAREAIQEAEATLAKKSHDIIGKEQAALIAKISAMEKDVVGALKSEYKQKIKDSKGNKEERKKLQKEIVAKTSAQLSDKIGSLLSAEQKEAVKAAAEKRAKRGKGEGRKKKQDAAGTEKEGKKNKKEKSKDEDAA